MGGDRSTRGYTRGSGCGGYIHRSPTRGSRGSRLSRATRRRGDGRRSIAYRRGLFRVRRRRRIRARTVEGSRVTCVRACVRALEVWAIGWR